MDRPENEKGQGPASPQPSESPNQNTAPQIVQPKMTAGRRPILKLPTTSRRRVRR